MSYSEFKSSVLHLKDNRNHTIKNSMGVYDAYKWIRKNKWCNIGRPITEHEFYKIVRKTNSYLAEELLKGEDIIFPHRMGKLELRKRNSIPTISKEGVLKETYAIDWDRTLKLWFNDEESFTNKTLVKLPEKEIFRVKYNKSTAIYKNKSIMKFNVNRSIKNRLKEIIKNNKIDAFSL